MPDTLDENGLQIEALNDTITTLQATWRSIYGSDINLDSNTPDGQLLNLIAQMARDNREICLSVYNSFDITKCTGSVLDMRVAYLGIKRKAGTYTQIPVAITVDRVTTISGLDSNYNSSTATSYTVSDGNNQFYALDTTVLNVGTTTITFRAANIGLVQVATNTVTTQVTPVVGVTSVNNPSGALATGENEETDAELRLRASRSYGLNSQGYLNGLEAKLLNLTGVTEAKVYENYTDTTDANSIPAHSIWCIVEGGADTDIANIIYQSKMPGCGMKGSITEDIITPTGDTKTFKFDRPTAQNLYIRFDLKPTTTGVTFNQSGIKSYMASNLTYSLNEYAETSKITASARDAIDATTGFGVPLNVEISANGSTWVDYLTPTTLDKEFTISASNITITEV
jgi:uncharacterized phage protein gp47/JayE